MRSLRDFWSSLRNAVSQFVPQLNRPLRIVGITVLVLIGIYAFYFVLEKVFIYLFARSYVEAIADAWDLNKNFANAIVWIVFIAFVVFVSLAFSISKVKRLFGIAGVLLLLVGQSLVVWRGTSDKFFERSGRATKCYVVTRDAVHYGERPGIDPATGRECRPVTPEIVERLKEYAAGKRPERIISPPTFFSLRTGEPIVWYYKNKNGNIELFSLMGFYPETGEELLPITKEIVAQWKQQAARRIPKKIDIEKYDPFDPVTGEPRVWYRKRDSGEFEFYDWFGYDPQSGEKLSVITPEVVDEWRKNRSNPVLPGCYVITRDGVHYGDKPGLDTATGRQCREVTPQILEQLRAYEDGNRPKKIESAKPTFFDPRTGEAITWYYKDKRGAIEIFDLMGFHPQTGEELLPVTKDVVELWEMQNGKRIPKRIEDPDKYDFFDKVTGEPRAWYWRAQNGAYEFYDGPGFHPRTGDRLLVVTREAIDNWKKQPAANKTPQLIDPKTYPFFDPNTGVAQVWYWRGLNGVYEFYDAPGFQPNTGDKLSIVTRDVVDQWRKANPTPQPPPPPEDKSELERLKSTAQDFYAYYQHQSSLDAAEVLALVPQTYAAEVDYYGERLSRQKVFDDKRRYMAKWPQRSFIIRPQATRISCSVRQSSCDVFGQVDFHVANSATNKESIGVTTFEMKISFSQGMPTIKSENGHVISRQILSPQVQPSPPPPYNYSGPPQNNYQRQQTEQMLRGLFNGLINRIGR